MPEFKPPPSGSEKKQEGSVVIRLLMSFSEPGCPFLCVCRLLPGEIRRCHGRTARSATRRRAVKNQPAALSIGCDVPNRESIAFTPPFGAPFVPLHAAEGGMVLKTMVPATASFLVIDPGMEIAVRDQLNSRCRCHECSLPRLMLQIRHFHHDSAVMGNSTPGRRHNMPATILQSACRRDDRPKSGCLAHH